MLRPKGSWGACTPHGIIHSSTVLHGADLYTPRYCYISPLCFTAQRRLEVHDPRHLDADVHSPGKRNTQKIERKHLTLRTRIKRLVVYPLAADICLILQIR